MTQSTVFPIRFGLPLQPPENIKSVEVFSEGGLDLTQTIIESRPGCASQLINFEAALTGGYRRINGYNKYTTVGGSLVPGSGPILGIAVAWPDRVIAARRDFADNTRYNIYWSNGTNAWTQLNPFQTTQSTITNGTTTLQVTNSAGLVPGQIITGTDIPAGTYIISITDGTHLVMSQAATGSTTNNRTFKNPLVYSSGMFITSAYYNWTGSVRTTFFDGVNFPYRWDITTGFTMLVGTAANPAPSNPQVGCEFQGYLFVGGFSSNPGAIAWSAPNADNDWAAADGAVTAVEGDTVTGLKVWRNQLIVFNSGSIHKVVPNSLNITGISPPPPFQIQPITDRIGCLATRSIRECNGDILYLAPDGIRTISGTFNIGDTEIGSISRPIQALVSSINHVTTPPMAVVCAKKTQYRLFYPDSTLPVANSLGIMGSVRRFRDGHEGWEWAQLRGFQPTAVDSRYLANGNEYIVHGDANGIVYRQEQGTTFNGAAINEIYTTVPLELGDISIRKSIRRITVYATTDNASTGAAATVALNVIYDYGDSNVNQPDTYILTGVGNATPAYDAGNLYDTGPPVVWGPVIHTAIKQLVQGSGFIMQLETTYGNPIPNTPVDYTIQGFNIEFFPAGRR